jgi:uncharacterized protein DUF1501
MMTIGTKQQFTGALVADAGSAALLALSPSPLAHEALEEAALGHWQPQNAINATYKAAEIELTNHNVHATLLHLLGKDHKRMTGYFNGRNMRLTDVSGELIPRIAGTKQAKA